MLSGLQTSPWEILWELKPLSAPSWPQVGHLLTLQGSEPSQPPSSENLAAFCSYIHSTNIDIVLSIGQKSGSNRSLAFSFSRGYGDIIKGFFLMGI